VVSLKVCQDIGIRGDISTVSPSISTELTSTMDFHMMILKNITPAILTRLPEDLTIFQVTIESG